MTLLLTVFTGGLALASNYDFFNYYFVLVITPMFIVSGVFYPVDTLPELMQTFDVFALSSLSEGTSVTLLEEMAAGKGK